MFGGHKMIKLRYIDNKPGCRFNIYQSGTSTHLSGFILLLIDVGNKGVQQRFRLRIYANSCFKTDIKYIA